MKKNIKYSDLVDIQLMSHFTGQIITRKEATQVLIENHFSHYPPLDGHNHTVAILKKDIKKLFSINGFDLLDNEGTQFSYDEVENIFLETCRPESHSSVFDLI